ncbi:hypothetical protein CR155_15335 [Pollutimonas nitritireducens]|uniref:Uncharacterized protein n=1 Tax=Pollutimonas nitritireducens TaxID=2045209 RepID=A0A2N4UDS5_9BURK|nr:hypothetical protein CR155_15335 [Pollutimonas nitritireducens]
MVLACGQRGYAADGSIFDPSAVFVWVGEFAPTRASFASGSPECPERPCLTRGVNGIYSDAQENRHVPDALQKTSR